jgi:hypothetical protein
LKPSFTALSLVFVLCATAPLASLIGQDDTTGYENALAQATQVIKTKIIPKYQTNAGFSVKPLDIDYRDDPVIAKSLDEYGSIWKQLDPVVADAYTSIQRKMNDRTNPTLRNTAPCWRTPLIRRFNFVAAAPPP